MANFVENTNFPVNIKYHRASHDHLNYLKFIYFHKVNLKIGADAKGYLKLTLFTEIPASNTYQIGQNIVLMFL